MLILSLSRVRQAKNWLTSTFLDWARRLTNCNKFHSFFGHRKCIKYIKIRQVNSIYPIWFTAEWRHPLESTRRDDSKCTLLELIWSREVPELGLHIYPVCTVLDIQIRKFPCYLSFAVELGEKQDIKWHLLVETNQMRPYMTTYD